MRHGGANPNNASMFHALVFISNKDCIGREETLCTIRPFGKSTIIR